MKTTGLIFVVLCSILLLRETAAHHFEDTVEANPVILIDPVPAEKPENFKEENKDITIDATIQSSAHIEIPEAVAEELLKAVVEAFNNMKISGEANVQSHVSMPKLQSRSKLATCDLLDVTGWSKTLCAAHCILLGHRGGYCNGRSICVCRD